MTRAPEDIAVAEHAIRIQRVYDDRTAGDGTFVALLAAFLRDVDAMRAAAGSQRWQPSRWWRVLGPDGQLWAETSDESEARERVRHGDTLQWLWTQDGPPQWHDAP